MAMKLTNKNLAALRVASALLMLMTVGSMALAQDDKHLVTPETWSTGPVSTSEMNRRIKEAAVDYREYAPIPRIGFYDIAHPANRQSRTAAKKSLSQFVWKRD
jgi:hypothetical protein